MDENLDLSMDSCGGEPADHTFETEANLDIGILDDYAEADELVDVHPESLEDTYVDEYSVSELLDDDLEQEWSPEPNPEDLALQVEDISDAENCDIDCNLQLNDMESLEDQQVEESTEAEDLPTEIDSVENISKWIEDINPNFDEFDIDSPYSNNCGSCAYAVYQRLEGNTDIVADAQNVPYNEDMESLTGMDQVSMSPWDIEKTLLAEGEGAHAIIGIDRAEGPGHWFNAVNIDGVVKAVDGQTGEISDWPPDYGDVVNWEMSIKKETLNG